MSTTLRFVLAALLGAALLGTALGASTDGTATFQTTIAHYSSASSGHWTVGWVTTQSGTFIKSLRKQGPSWAFSDWQNHCTQWNNARAGSTSLDGYSSATATTYTGTNSPVLWTWNCRDANNNLVADGTYIFWLQYAEDAGLGPYTTNGMAWTKGPTAATNTFPDIAPMTARKIIWTPAVTPHDLAVLSLTPTTVAANTMATLQVLVTNQTATTESFSVTLSNLNNSTSLGTQAIGSLPGNTSTNVAFTWNTAGLNGNYSLQATAGPVSGETSTTDNTLTSAVSVQVITHDIAVTSLTPTLAPANTNATVYVLVTNKTSNAETFSVMLSNLTTATLIRSQAASLAGYATTNVALQWSTTNLLGLYTLQATAGPVASEAATADNTLSAAMTVRVYQHDLGLLGLSAPALVLSNTTNTVTVLATNLGDFTEGVSVRLYDDTDVRLVGSNWVNSLALAGTSNLTFAWRTTNSLYGFHALRAVANPVAGETNLVNNTNLLTVALANGWVTNAFIAKGSTWRYNDQGLDFTVTPWLLPNYYDALWSQGAAPLGYSQNGKLTNLTTTVSWGPTATNKYPAYYFRQPFNVDVLPAAVTLNVRACDGAVVYLNGAELARFNLPAGPIAYTNLAAGTVSGLAQYAYLSSNAIPTNLVLGANELAVEVHRASLTNSDLAFDLEMLGGVPQFPATHTVDALGLTPGTNVLAGDQMPVSVSLTNRGNVTESVLVVLKNNTTGQVIGTQSVTGLVPGGSATVQFNWGTLGALSGANNLAAYTVVGGVTNFAGAFTNTAYVSGASLSTNFVNAVGAVGGRCAAMATTGNLLLVGAGATLEVWDRSVPAALARRGAVRLPGLIEGIAASASYAYVACGPAGVQVVDLTSPAVPFHRSTLNTSGHAYAVAVNGIYLYVAAGSAGLRVLSLANPVTPALVGAFYTPGPARAVGLAGANLCLLDQHQGLLVLNMANPASPALVGACTNFDAGQALAISGATACVVDGNNHLFLVNIANPAAPSLAGSLLLSGMAGQAVAANGTTVYVAAGPSGLLAIDASTPSAPVLTSTTPTPGVASALALAGSALYVADSVAGLDVLSLGAPPSFLTQSSFPTALRANDVVMTNGLAYVAAGEGGLQIFTLTNPFAPLQLSRFNGVTNARAIALSGTTAFVGDGQYGLKIVSVANPLAPALLGTYSSANLGSIRNVGASGSLVVVSDGRTLQLLDASVPATPALAGTYSPPAFAYSLALAGSKAYVACGNSGLMILNVTPGAFNVLGSYASSDPVSGVAVSGTKAYLANPATGWRILDVSNAAAPALVNVVTAQGPTLDVAASGTNVFLATATNTLATLDVTAPLTPVQSSSFGPLVQAVRLATAAPLTVAGEGEAGMTIFSTTDDLNHDGIPDWWELQMVALSLATNGPIRTIWDVHPNDDFDGDGVSNLAEYLAGTSPVDPHSVFMMSAQPSANKSVFNICWYSVAGKTYTIYKSTNLLTGFSVFRDNIAGTPPLNLQTDSATNGAAFYMIGVR